MHVEKLDSMVKGWFIGDFEPTLLATQDVEVGVKKYPAGSSEEWHLHKIATEYTVIISGDVEMNGHRYKAGDIIVIPPGEGTDFKTLSETTTVVVKIPGAKNDKYLKNS